MLHGLVRRFSYEPSPNMWNKSSSTGCLKLVDIVFPGDIEQEMN
jgi:hypothetical protein